MANIRKCASGTEAASDALVAIIDKALAYPKKGTRVGGGRHAAMPETWDGQGRTPPGWTKHAVANWVASAASAVVPITDDMATLLQRPAALARLNAGEQTVLLTAIAARSDVDTEAGEFRPKASAAGQAESEGKAR